jgi:peptide/nickel transport system permease protein
MTPTALLRFTARRVLGLVAVLLVVSFAVFTLLYLAPGSTERTLLGTRPATPEMLAALRHEYHLDKPFLDQYALWLRGAVRLDLGRSAETAVPVTTAIRSRLGVTLFLGLYSFVLMLAIGLVLGAVAALRRRSFVDRGIVAASTVGVSVPAFASGVVLLYVFAVAVPVFPAFGAGSGFVDRLSHLTLPAVALALAASALLIRLTRTALANVLEQDYILFARARGISRRRILFNYAFRNALIPVITAAGLLLTIVLTGAVLVESTFDLPGLGSLLVGAIGTKDIPTVQGVTLLFSFLIVAINFLVDLLYVAVDPRVAVR